MSVVAFAKSRRGQAARKLAADRALSTRPAPSGDLINAILQYADMRQDLGGGRVRLWLSARRRKDPVIGDLLGRETRRLADVSIVWDEREDQIFRVMDAAAGDHLTLVADDEPEPAFDEDLEDAAFELTPAALAYLAAHPTRP